MNDGVLEINNYSIPMMAYKLYLDTYKSYTNRIIYLSISFINTISIFYLLNYIPVIPRGVFTLGVGLMLLVFILREYAFIHIGIFNHIAPLTISMWIISKYIDLVVTNFYLYALIIVLLSPLWLYTSYLVFEYNGNGIDSSVMLFNQVINGPLFIYLETRWLLGIDYCLNQDFYDLDKKGV